MSTATAAAAVAAAAPLPSPHDRANLTTLFASWLTVFVPQAKRRIFDFLVGDRRGAAAAAARPRKPTFTIYVEMMSGVRVATLPDVNPAACTVGALKAMVHAANPDFASINALRLFRLAPRRELAKPDRTLARYGVVPRDREAQRDSDGSASFVLTAVRMAQRQALEQFYEALSGKQWTAGGIGSKTEVALSKWCTSAPLSEWHGVTVNADGRVAGLYLSGMNLSGQIPSGIWAHLTSITSIGLQNNSGVHGPVPHELGYLEGLGFLGLEGTKVRAPPGAPTSSYGLYFDDPEKCAAFTRFLRHHEASEEAGGDAGKAR